MLRAKCTFLRIIDIIETVDKIKKYVADNSKFGILKIQSRYTSKIQPISDVTLKIVINNEIIAELQLTT